MLIRKGHLFREVSEMKFKTRYKAMGYEEVVNEPEPEKKPKRKTDSGEAQNESIV